MTVDVKYRATVTVIGGRDGHARGKDGSLDLKLSTPRELGGPGGDGTNPEELFAAGYAACFIGAIRFAAQQMKVDLPDEPKVTATVGIGLHIGGGYGLTAELHVDLGKALNTSAARQLVDRAHELCPYSNATRGNIAVDIELL